MTPNADDEGSGPEEAIAGHQWDIEGFPLHLWPGEFPGRGCATTPRASGRSAGTARGDPSARGVLTGTAWDMLIECLDALILRNLGERGQT